MYLDLNSTARGAGSKISVDPELVFISAPRVLGLDLGLRSWSAVGTRLYRTDINIVVATCGALAGAARGGGPRCSPHHPSTI
eukprot:SAG31_NODE_36887_length_309_cov_0.966667_1_plen_81_part_01